MFAYIIDWAKKTKKKKTILQQSEAEKLQIEQCFSIRPGASSQSELSAANGSRSSTPCQEGTRKGWENKAGLSTDLTATITYPPVQFLCQYKPVPTLASALAKITITAWKHWWRSYLFFSASYLLRRR